MNKLDERSKLLQIRLERQMTKGVAANHRGGSNVARCEVREQNLFHAWLTFGRGNQYLQSSGSNGNETSSGQLTGRDQEQTEERMIETICDDETVQLDPASKYMTPLQPCQLIKVRKIRMG